MAHRTLFVARMDHDDADKVAALFPPLAPDLDGLDPYTAWAIAGRHGDASVGGARPSPPSTSKPCSAAARRCWRAPARSVPCAKSDGGSLT